MAKSTNNSNSSDGLALIVGGLFVLSLVFATYSYFNKEPADLDLESSGTTNLDNKLDEETKNSLSERIKELFNAQKEDGDLNGVGASTKVLIDNENNEDSEVLGTGGPVEGIWMARNYEAGDITGNSYVVKSGDTLWEIAEAKYGNGTDWVKILEANSSEIGYLLNGQQALIVPGQTLVLP